MSENVIDHGAPPILSRELRERTRLPHHTVKRYLRELEELEYIAVTRGVRGAASAYRLVEMEEKSDRLDKSEKSQLSLTPVRGLLSVEELAKKLGERSSARSARAEQIPSPRSARAGGPRSAA